MANSHLKALLRKNFILWKRSWIFSILEIALPGLFALLYYAFRAASPLVDVPEKSYANSPSIFEGSPAVGAILKRCSAKENGGMVALAP